jgi:hypothetical protein
MTYAFDNPPLELRIEDHGALLAELGTDWPRALAFLLAKPASEPARLFLVC